MKFRLCGDEIELYKYKLTLDGEELFFVHEIECKDKIEELTKSEKPYIEQKLDISAHAHFDNTKVASWEEAESKINGTWNEPINLEKVVKEIILNDITIDYDAPLDIVKQSAIAFTKAWVKLQCDKPFTHNDEEYTITEEKQRHLTSLMITYDVALRAGVTLPLSWNVRGQSCTPCSAEELTGLSISIFAHVYKLRAKQQTAEIMISMCQTTETIKTILEEFKE